MDTSNTSLFDRFKRPKLLKKDRSSPAANSHVFDDSDEEIEESFGGFDDEKFGDNSPSRSSTRLSVNKSGRSVSAPEVRGFSLPNSNQNAYQSNSTYTTKKVERDPLGLTTFVTPINPVVDIIFIHGLGGSARKSWALNHDPQLFWPAWLNQEAQLTGARLHTFGYEAGITGSATSMTIREFAKTLLFKMKYNNQDGPSIGELPIVLLAHSMGGLVAKMAYIVGGNDHEYADIVSSIRAMIFFSTPHRGGQGADRLASILGVFGLTKEYVKDLAANSNFLLHINDEFTNVCGNLKLYSFYETKKTSYGPRSEFIVNKDSGIMNLPNEEGVPVVADHHSICKFPHVRDPGYLDVCNVLIALVKPFQLGDAKLSSCDDTATIGKIRMILDVKESTVSENLQRFCSIAKEGTCRWIESRTWYQEWSANETDQPYLLWLSGEPAAGKSVLCHYILETLQQRYGNDACQYHTFSFEDKTQRSASYLLRSIAYQIASQSSTVSTGILSMSEQFGVAYSKLSAAQIWEKLYKGLIFNLARSRTLFWILDGLDESETETISQLFNFLKSLDRDLRIKVLIVSRPLHDISMRVQQLSMKRYTHQLSTIDTYEDIRSYVEDAVAILIPGAISSRQRVVDKVMKKSSGNFLWVTLTSRDLEQSWHRRSDIEHTLSGFPGEMSPLYSRMMEKVEAQSEDTKRIATAFLAWAAYCLRPLHTNELKAALGQDFPDLTSLEDTMHHICAGFIQVRNSKATLVHETAHYFLANNCANRAVMMSPSEGHEFLAISCLNFLRSTHERPWIKILKAIEDRRSKQSKKGGLTELTPFLSYAATSWAYHASLANPDSSKLRDALYDFFDQNAISWINALTLLGDLKSLVRAAKLMKTYVNNREKSRANKVPENLFDDIDFLKQWAVDLIKLVGKFGSNLLNQPSSIYKSISPFCPTDSILRKTLLQHHPTFSLEGVTFPQWDDCHARLSVGGDQTASKVIATTEIFAALVPQGHGLVVWHAETCEELRRMHHGEYVTCIAVSRKGDLACTTGFQTIKVWEISTGNELASLAKHTDDKALSVAFGAQDDHILIGYQDQLIVCMDWKRQKVLSAFHTMVEDHSVAPGGLRIVSFSPDRLRVAIGARSRPVEIWDLVTQTRLHRCVMAGETLHGTGAVFLEAEAIQWHPHHGNVYILYHDTTLIDWNPDFDNRSPYFIGAKNIECSPCGNYLIASEDDGAIKVYMLPDYSRTQRSSLNLIYHLEYSGFVRDIAFSPDGQRFYEVRDSICTVWEPDVLVVAEKPEDEEDRSTNYSESTLALDTLRSSATTHNRAEITALTCVAQERGFCCGRDDGTLTIHDMSGKKIRSLPGHATDMAIIALAWSSSTGWIASADDSGHVLVRKIRLGAPSEKPALYKPASFRIKDDGIDQLLFSSDDKFLLVSTLSADRIWDVAKKQIVHVRQHSSRRKTKWIEHPGDPSRLVSINAGEVYIFDWNEFVDLTDGRGIPFSRMRPENEDSPPSPKSLSTSRVVSFPTSFDNLNVSSATDEAVTRITKTGDKRSIIFETTT